MTLIGSTDCRRLEERVPMVSFTLNNWHPRQLAETLREFAVGRG